LQHSSKNIVSILPSSVASFTFYGQCSGWMHTVKLCCIIHVENVLQHILFKN
jgi:hypothetical protein